MCQRTQCSPACRGLDPLSCTPLGTGHPLLPYPPSAVESAHLPILRVPQLHVAVPRPHHDLQLGYRRMFVHPDFLRLLSCMPKGRVVQDTSPETAETADVCMYVCTCACMYACNSIRTVFAHVSPGQYVCVCICWYVGRESQQVRKKTRTHVDTH